MEKDQGFTHLDENGRAKMVDVGEKEVTRREAIAEGSITLSAQTFARVKEGPLKKGDVLAAAQLAGIMAAKRTSELIPMAHSLFLEGVKMSFAFDDAALRIVIRSQVRCTAKTGVEMEALTAVSVAALTIYDMCKALDRNMEIGGVRLLYKTGGKTQVNLL